MKCHLNVNSITFLILAALTCMPFITSCSLPKYDYSLDLQRRSDAKSAEELPPATPREHDPYVIYRVEKGPIKKYEKMVFLFLPPEFTSNITKKYLTISGKKTLGNSEEKVLFNSFAWNKNKYEIIELLPGEYTFTYGYLKFELRCGKHVMPSDPRLKARCIYINTGAPADTTYHDIGDYLTRKHTFSPGFYTLTKYVYKWDKEMSPSEMKAFHEGRRLLTQKGGALLANAIKNLNDADSSIRFAAIKDLREIGDESAMEPLIASLTARYPIKAINIFPVMQTIARRTFKSFGKIGKLRSIEPIIFVLKDQKKMSYESLAARTLGLLRDKRAVFPLIEALDLQGRGEYYVEPTDRERENYKIVIIKALEKITLQKFGDNSIKWREWWENNNGKKQQ